ncbi:hypothetical protein DCAR_0830672 [Daucus carota subsp. sativus]|uniref:Reverse transcriptase domain-containing protein n=1 Tax=Daucus carota subsp. sativus TaxID=79200 RepID=A0AAF0XQ41_DAUCS|nr:hypothetical protein DCAR_0830672 [Daucus carota subsp. sativus]
MLCQKSRANWSLHGERNSSFFHRIMIKRRSHNAIRKLQLEETIFFKPLQIKRILKTHFQSLLSDTGGDKVFSIGNLIQSKLSLEQSMGLEREFTMQEIELALKNTDKSKAPGPDGINAGVLVLLWPEIKLEVLKFFKDFHCNGFLPRGCNSSVIALIPKRPNAAHPSDFRPISLMNVLLKLLTKVMATRLSAHMHNLVSEQQSAFIKGRQITDGILITSEVVSLLQQDKIRGLVFKIDFEKAFDRVKWSFVLEVLKAMNFGSAWIAWIQAIFESSSISVLVNGSPTTEFRPSRGLRQGDPLFPLIFNLVGEALSCMLVKGANENLYRGITLKDTSNTITHLQFADDVILFLNDDYSSILGVKRLLQCFQIISGMKVNFSKSQVYGFHIDGEVKKKWARQLNCILGSVPFRYLGAQIGASPTSIKFWDPLIERFKRKVNGYEASKISMAGRAVLLQATIDSTPVYWLSLYKIPTTVVQKIEIIRRRFLWGEDIEGKRKVHLISWDKICRSKVEGGLNITSLKDRNHALLSKWWWRAYSERGSFWNNFFTSCYGNSWNYRLGSIPPRACTPIVRSLLSIQHVDQCSFVSNNDSFFWMWQRRKDILLGRLVAR